MPVPFDGVVLGINYTHISSAATYPLFYDISTGTVRNIVIVTIDSSRSGRLVNQPNNILNAYLGYDYKGFSGRISVLFQGNSVSYIGAFPEQDGYTKDYFRLDASAKQMLPWFHIQLFVDLNNINNAFNSAAQNSIGGFTSRISMASLQILELDVFYNFMIENLVDRDEASSAMCGKCKICYVDPSMGISEGQRQ